MINFFIIKHTFSPNSIFILLFIMIKVSNNKQYIFTAGVISRATPIPHFIFKKSHTLCLKFYTLKPDVYKFVNSLTRELLFIEFSWLI